MRLAKGEINLNFGMNVTITQTLSQKLSLDQLQHLNILQLSTAELECYIQEKAHENPLLTIAEPKMDVISNLVDRASVHTDYPTYHSIDADATFTQNLFVAKESPVDHLLEQIPINQHFTPKEIRILKYLIHHLNDYYFLELDLVNVAHLFDTDFPQIEKMLATLQTFEPIGVGARNLQEFLLIQIQRDPYAPPLASAFVSEHLTEVANLSIKLLSKYYKISVTETKNIIHYIKNLKPIPTAGRSDTNELYIIPEISVEKKSGEWIIQTNRQLRSSLSVNEEYVELLKHNSETKDYCEHCLKDVLLLLHGIEQRDRTLYKLTRLLLDVQADFFDYGMSALQPINLKEIAALLKLHESTISRAIKNKYIKTPHGIYPFKSLFPKGITNTSGKKDSVLHIKDKIKAFIQNEEKSSPLTDQQLTEKLLCEGIRISRRTVAKYREQLNFLNSDKRVYLYQS